MPAALETWSVTATIVQQFVGTHAPALSTDTDTTVTAHIAMAAGEINARLRQWTGLDASAIAAGTTEAALEVQEIAAGYIKNRAAELWLRRSSREKAQDYGADARQIMTDARYSVPEARAALAPTINFAGTTDPTTSRSQAPDVWLDEVPDGEAFS